MTKNSPRIYVYKITFEEVPYYYYGVKKEKYFNEEYWGSPKTNKWCWELYTPKKQILELFDFTDEGWIEAQKVEDRLIKPFYNTDKWCLNENCGGIMSLDSCRNGGKITGNKMKEEEKGIFSLSKDEWTKNRRKSGLIAGNKLKEEGRGIFGLTDEENLKNCRVGGNKIKELGIGIHAQTKEQRIENGKKAAKITNSQKWMCLETGFSTNPGNLTKYQKARRIDTSKRVRVS
jgi:hypothetical protein